MWREYEKQSEEILDELGRNSNDGFRALESAECAYWKKIKALKESAMDKVLLISQ